jgi:predicted restriction endonuclease
MTKLVRQQVYAKYNGRCAYCGDVLLDNKHLKVGDTVKVIIKTQTT